MADSVTAVLFDLDETLCCHPTSGPERLAAAFERAGVDPCFTYDEYAERCHAIGGTGSDVRRRERAMAGLARERGRSESVGLRVADAYAAVTDYTEVELLPAVEGVLDDLGERYRLGLVTNGGPDTQSVKVDALGIRERFETVVLAGWETAAKPDPEPFAVALADLGVAPDEAVHVGNSLSRDVAGAAAAGIRSVWIPFGEARRDGSIEPTHTLSAFEALRSPPWEHVGEPGRR